MSTLTRKCKLLVTGAAGQLGLVLAEEVDAFTEVDAVFLSKAELDVCNPVAVEKAIVDYQPTHLVNAAAYTAVDKAEMEIKEAYALNEDAVSVLALSCKKAGVAFIHISTDYVFDGKASEPYAETATVNPQTVYGKSKRAGEIAILNAELTVYAIIRTGWLYSAHGTNFLKTMLRLGKEREEVAVVADQIGAPTAANDLARALLKMALKLEKDTSGIYHFSNSGEGSWYDFAALIFEEKQIDVELIKTDSVSFKTAAERPLYSVLSSDKIRVNFGVEVPEWRESAVSILSMINN